MTLSLSSHFCEFLNEGTTLVVQGAQDCVQDTEITIHPHPMVERAGGFHYCFRYDILCFFYSSRLPLGHPFQTVGLRYATSNNLPLHDGLISEHHRGWASFHCPIQYVPIQQPSLRQPSVSKPIGCPTGVILISEFLEGKFPVGLKPGMVLAMSTIRGLLVSQARSGFIMSSGVYRIRINSEGSDIAVS